MKPDEIGITKWPDRVSGKMLDLKYEIFLSKNFSQLSDITQVYGLVINDKNQILLVARKNKVWILPGETVEHKETPLETLSREVHDETSIIIYKLRTIAFFYQKSYTKKGKNWIFTCTQVRYITRILKQEQFITDPDGHVLYHKFVNIDNLHKFLKWGKTTEFIQKHFEKQLENI